MEAWVGGLLAAVLAPQVGQGWLKGLISPEGDTVNKLTLAWRVELAWAGRTAAPLLALGLGGVRNRPSMPPKARPPTRP